jgi:hypothetical protein
VDERAEERRYAHVLEGCSDGRIVVIEFVAGMRVASRFVHGLQHATASEIGEYEFSIADAPE